MPTDPRFMACLFDDDDLVEIRLLPRGERRFVKADAITVLDTELDEANAAGKNVCVGANPRKRQGGKAEDVVLARCLFVDIDGTDVGTAIKLITDAHLPTPTCIVNSGHGLHAYWRLSEPMLDVAAWTEAQKHLARLLDSDPKVHDLPRIMRLPAFFNHKPPKSKCNVIEANPQCRYNLGDILPNGADGRSRESRESRAIRALTCNVSATADQVIVATIPKDRGQRNACIMDLARGLKFEAGLGDRPLSQVKPLVRKWHEKSLLVIKTKEFDESWSDFIRAWESALIPLYAKAKVVGSAYVDAAAQATAGELPRCADQYDSQPVRLLVGMCANLARLQPNGRFFLSTHNAAKWLDLHPAQAWRYLQMLRVDGVIRMVKAGNQRSATRYRWCGNDSEDVP